MAVSLQGLSIVHWFFSDNIDVSRVKQSLGSSLYGISLIVSAISGGSLIEG